MIIIPKTLYVGRNIKSYLPDRSPDRSKATDLGKIVFLNHPFWVKNGQKVLSKINEIKSKLTLL